MRTDHPSTLRSAVEPQSRISNLLKRAMSYLERDRAEAGRCLRDAYTLLGGALDGAPVDEPASQRTIKTGALAAWQVRRALDYIEEHLGSKLAAEDIAATIGLSKSHFSRAFKNSVGSPPMVYVARRRVEHAKLMMSSTTEPLVDVAAVCGFADQSHLTRCFHRIVGLPPGRWRRSSQHAPRTLAA